ncbi:hypothetical protein F4806DRAFT_455438 [Annulohypoxylon nitens]|nr:hypothetical protein F4806DRAFT_455438 [Annulohypoxylon nitens]
MLPKGLSHECRTSVTACMSMIFVSLNSVAADKLVPVAFNAAVYSIVDQPIMANIKLRISLSWIFLSTVDTSK